MDCQPPELNVLLFVKGDERYAFTFPDDSTASVIWLLFDFASRADLEFSWADAAGLAKQIYERNHT